MSGVSNNSLTSPVEASLPNEIKELNGSLFPLQRELDNPYLSLPWPEKIKNIVVFTEVRGGRGDIAAAAKAIGVMQRLCPELVFDWVLTGYIETYNPKGFLNGVDSSKVTIRAWGGSCPPESTPADFLLVGPVRFAYEIDYVERKINRTIAGPTLGFQENAESLFDCRPQLMQGVAQSASLFKSSNNIYKKLHKYAFPDKSNNSIGLLTMGLYPGSGVFLDPNRIETSLSRGYCCPSYLTQIQDSQLRTDILRAMGVADDKSLPDYDKYSFNSGYAHTPASWDKYINCVAIHEQAKNVVIVLNQHGEFDSLSTEEFQQRIFTPERLSFLKEKGFTTVTLKGMGRENINLAEITRLQPIKDEAPGRSFKVIIRHSFLPGDMKRMQLASERLLATGDNSALESWCARCILYLYEDVANGGTKWRFLQQQVDVAQKISPKLARLLALFGGDKRISEMRPNQPLSLEHIEEMEQLLTDPQLGADTLKFCEHITENYSFQPVLEAALKRTIWHHCIPELANIEAEGLDKEFKEGLVSYLKDPKNGPKSLQITSLQELGSKVHETVQKYLAK